MKKIIYICVYLSAFVPLGLAASECSQSCQISDAPAPALTEYFTNLDEITSNLLSGISEANDSDDDGPVLSGETHERNRVMAAMNSILSFRDYFGSFDYYISLPMTQEVPSEVRRDHDRIIRETERLTTLLETTSRRSQTHLVIENICSGISHCQFGEQETAQVILTGIIQNNQKIAQLYRASVLDRPELATDRNFILVADDFVSQIESHYNRDTLTACSSCDEGFLDTVREAIRDISFKNSDYKEGVQKWKDAWAMLMGGGGSSVPNRDREESEATEEYLQSQGIESNQGDIIVTNIDRYGEAFSSLDPTMNSYFQSSAGNVSRALSDHQIFLETIEEAERNDEGNIPYLEMTRVNAQSQDEEDISASIATLYEDQLPYAFVQDTVSAELQARIIRMHFDLVYTSNLLGEQTSRTERLCDKQATGRGRCEY